MNNLGYLQFSTCLPLLRLFYLFHQLAARHADDREFFHFYALISLLLVAQNARYAQNELPGASLPK